MKCKLGSLHLNLKGRGTAKGLSLSQQWCCEGFLKSLAFMPIVKPDKWHYFSMCTRPCFAHCEEASVALATSRHRVDSAVPSYPGLPLESRTQWTTTMELCGSSRPTPARWGKGRRSMSWLSVLGKSEATGAFVGVGRIGNTEKLWASHSFYWALSCPACALTKQIAPFHKSGARGSVYKWSLYLKESIKRWRGSNPGCTRSKAHAPDPIPSHQAFCFMAQSHFLGFHRISENSGCYRGSHFVL